MFDKEIFANRLKELREKIGLNQKECAEKLNISRGSISFYENGERLPDIETIYNMSNFFNVSADYLVGLADEPSNNPEINDIKAYTGLTENSIEFLHSLFCDLKEYNSYISNGGESKNELTALYEHHGYLLHFLNDALACDEIKEVSKYAKKYIDAVCDCTRFGTEEPNLAKFMYQNMCIALLDKISFSAVRAREKHLKEWRRIMTNYDRIKAMSVEEMADYFNGIFDCSNCPNDMFLCESKDSVCTKYIKQWLEQEVSE